jgi:hypothetical protein
MLLGRPLSGFLAPLLALAASSTIAATVIKPHNYRDKNFDYFVTGDPTPPRAADGIFLAGGDQGNHIRCWKGTPVQDALNAHVLANPYNAGVTLGSSVLGWMKGPPYSWDQMA